MIGNYFEAGFVRKITMLFFLDFSVIIRITMSNRHENYYLCLCAPIAERKKKWLNIHTKPEKAELP